MDSCQGVAMQLLGFYGWLPGCCYAVARVLWVVARVLLCSYYGVMGSCQSVAMQLLGCYGWLSGCCYVVARVF